jgi:glyoxylase-like metal-dependent hydrolase (beta-lactamase superfamily II)
MRAIAAALLLAFPATAAETLETLRDFETVKVADGVYAFIARQTRSPLVSGNSVAVIGDDSVLVVDTGHFPSGTRQMVAAIKKLSQKPVRFVVNTHWHPDHETGNSVYQDAFPGVTIISTRATRDAFSTDLPKYEAAGMRAQVPLLREALKTGKTRRGAPLTEARRGAFTDALAQLDTVLPDLESARHLEPSLTFTDELRIHLGKREVRVLFLGRGNTTGDGVVYVPDAKLVATGDLVVHPIPYAFGSFFGEWPKTLDALLALDADVLVPGHGPVLHDKSYPKLVARLISSISSQAKTAAARNLSLEEARKQLDIAELRKELTHGDADLDKDLDAFVLDPGFPRAYREAKEGPLKDEN